MVKQYNITVLIVENDNSKTVTVTIDDKSKLFDREKSEQIIFEVDKETSLRSIESTIVTRLRTKKNEETLRYIYNPDNYELKPEKPITPNSNFQTPSTRPKKGMKNAE